MSEQIRYGVFLRPDPATSVAVTQITERPDRFVDPFRLMHGDIERERGAEQTADAHIDDGEGRRLARSWLPFTAPTSWTLS